jgi:hypothetical protein
MTGTLEIIDAFVDGEEVDVTALRAALADREGLDYFVDALKLQRVVSEEGPPAHTSLQMRARAWPASWRSWLVPATAAIVMFGAAFAAGRWQATSTEPNRSSLAAPAPQPDRIVAPEIGRTWIETPAQDAPGRKEG